MLMFFNSHQCNDHCRSLGLLNPKVDSKLPKGFKLIADPEEGKTINSRNLIHKLCDLCRKPFQTTFGHYYFQREQGYELWCDPCTAKRNNTFKEADCKLCGKHFKSSAYWFQMKKANFPDQCCACRLSERERMRGELEGIFQPEKQCEYIIEMKEAKGKHGKKKIAGLAPAVKAPQAKIESKPSKK
jgi:hypothetical protein